MHGAKTAPPLTALRALLIGKGNQAQQGENQNE